MGVNIHFDHEINEEKSLQLDELAQRLAEDEHINVEKICKESESGTKVGDLTIAISIVSLALSSISTIITVLSYLKSRQSDYTISVRYGETTITIDHWSQVKVKQNLSKMR